MFKVLIDTCVWLDIAQDAKYGAQIEGLRELIKQKKLSLIMPRTVLTEFQKNKQRIGDKAERSLSSHFNIVRDAIKKFEVKTAHREKVLKHLADLDHKIPLLGGATSNVLGQLEEVMKETALVETSEAIKLRAADRALKKVAPCHHDNKNSIADAVILETYFDEIAKGKTGDRFAFVTHNKKDFSAEKADDQLPHPTLSDGFSKIKSLYFISLGDCLKRIDPELLQMIKFEVEYTFEVRTLSEIMDAMDTLTSQIWYNRHKNTEYYIAKGKNKLVTREEWEANSNKKGYMQTHIIDTIWKGALESARRKEKKLGEGNYGPWSDFEWGMLNGKLSALRWALGDDWDMLDT